MRTLEIDVSNVKCAGCVSNIQKGLREIDGVQDVSVDIPSGHVSIQGEVLDAEIIRQKLTSLGYPPLT